MEVEALAPSFRSKFIKQVKMRGLEQGREKHPGVQNSLKHFKLRKQQVVQDAGENARFKRSGYKLCCVP